MRIHALSRRAKLTMLAVVGLAVLPTMQLISSTTAAGASSRSRPPVALRSGPTVRTIPGPIRVPVSTKPKHHKRPHRRHDVPSEPMKDFELQPATLSPAEWGAALGFAERAGARIVSFDVSWSSYEPNGPAPAGEWTNLDAFVAAARHRGFLIRIQLVGLPSWARSAGEPGPTAEPWRAPSTAPELASWAEFVGRVARHFRTNVAYYEIWNEENLSDFWQQGPDPTEYARLLEASYVAIKAADASALVMFGGLSRNDAGFLEQTYSALDQLFSGTAAADHHFFDILGAHPYSGDRPPNEVMSRWVYRDQWGTMDENFLGIKVLHDVMVRHDEAWKHVYISEYGFDTSKWEIFAGVADAVRARYLKEAFAAAASTGYVDALSWYCSYTTPWNDASWALLKGNYPNWTPTLTFESLASIPNS